MSFRQNSDQHKPSGHLVFDSDEKDMRATLDESQVPNVVDNLGRSLDNYLEQTLQPFQGMLKTHGQVSGNDNKVILMRMFNEFESLLIVNKIENKTKMRYNQLKELGQDLDSKIGQYRDELERIQRAMNKALQRQKSVDDGIKDLGNVMDRVDDIVQRDQKNVLNQFESKIKSDFEPYWLQWNCDDMCHWLKYLVTSQNLGLDARALGIDWQSVLLNLRQRTHDYGGKYLRMCDEKELSKLGFEHDGMRKYLLTKIKELVTTNDTNDGGNQNQEKSQCVICLSENPNMACVPCGHVCMCRDCTKQYDSNICPVCRQNINTVMAVYV